MSSEGRVLKNPDRIEVCGFEAGRSDISRNLLHAYVACLTPSELCGVATRELDGSGEILAAVRSRMRSLGERGRALREFDALARQLIASAHLRGKARTRAESLLSHVYAFVAPDTRRRLLERWRDRGTRDATARWLNAFSDDKLLFNIDEVLDYWRRSRDERAAKLLADRGEPNLIADLLPDLIAECGEGWVVGRAVLRARSVNEQNWEAIRDRFPATYAYLCAKTRRALSEEDAFAIVEETSRGPSDIGLAIWAIGQLGMAPVLDRIWEMRDEIQDRRFEQLAALGNNP